MRAALRTILLAAHLSVAPSWVEAWRLDPTIRSAVTLVVGGPVLPFRPRSSDRNPG